VLYSAKVELNNHVTSQSNVSIEGWYKVVNKQGQPVVCKAAEASLRRLRNRRMYCTCWQQSMYTKSTYRNLWQQISTEFLWGTVSEVHPRVGLIRVRVRVRVRVWVRVSG